ncbi:helix-turn-helix domain-containing protein [Streptococcus parasanguinis]|jgi:DNA-binding helix-turn-helix protein|uniref:helix-turn-helix domain-containing protein n=1 Tax=Streptococcus parasanguinis TaxID=1318 RepID=UPI001E474ABB|nr:helix-turn-helix transcriptional regulator [Streptococcus parasanguinis]
MNKLLFVRSIIKTVTMGELILKPFIKDRIFAMLYKKSMNVKDLASKSNLSRQTISKLLSNNSYNPKLSTLVAVSNALSINLDDLLDENTDFSTEKKFHNNSLDYYQNILIQNVKLYLRRNKQYSLSYNGGVRESTISNIVNKKNSDLRLKTITSISTQMGVEINYLFTRGEK